MTVSIESMKLVTNKAVLIIVVEIWEISFELRSPRLKIMNNLLRIVKVEKAPKEVQRILSYGEQRKNVVTLTYLLKSEQ